MLASRRGGEKMADYKVYGRAEADCCIIRLLGEHENAFIDNELEAIRQLQIDSWCMIAVPVKDWNLELTPWKNDYSQEKTGGAASKLEEIQEVIIPDFENAYPNDNRNYYIAGYSLAGLFALWSSYQSERFKGVAAVSPSVWYPGWIEYAGDNTCKAAQVYLSLGNKEHKTRNRQMAAVKSCIEQQYELLQADNKRVALEWNDGNHFANVTERMVKGIAAVMNM